MVALLSPDRWQGFTNSGPIGESHRRRPWFHQIRSDCIHVVPPQGARIVGCGL